MKDIPSFRVNGEYAHIRVCENLLNAHPIIHSDITRIVHIMQFGAVWFVQRGTLVSIIQNVF